MKYKQIDKSLFVKNRQKLFSKMISGSIAVINSNDEMPRNGDQYFKFRQHSDLFYLTGIEQEETTLLLMKTDKEEKIEKLFILKSNPEKEIWDGHKLTIEEAIAISGIKEVFLSEDFQSVFNDCMLQSSIFYYNLNENKRFKTLVPYRDVRFFEEIKKKYPAYRFERLYPLMESIRLIKEPEEIELIKKACEITNYAFNEICRVLKPGMIEYEVEAVITNEFIRRGADGHAYLPIVAGGRNACVLHYIENNKLLCDGDLVLIDFGAEYANYASDCTRTLPVNGKFTERQKFLYLAVLDIFKKAFNMMVPGNTINQIQELVCSWSQEWHIKAGLYSMADVQKQPVDAPMFKKYYMHGVSHYLGLDVHDVGEKDIPLQEGMVVTCEPGLYIADENTGIRIETDVLITNNGPVDLFPEIPLEPDEIEKWLKNDKR